ncbi:hypothetical protein SAURM35S_00005 [Streptomyces aurantiogriseus]
MAGLHRRVDRVPTHGEAMIPFYIFYSMFGGGAARDALAEAGEPGAGPAG